MGYQRNADDQVIGVRQRGVSRAPTCDYRHAPKLPSAEFNGLGFQVVRVERRVRQRCSQAAEETAVVASIVGDKVMITKAFQPVYAEECINGIELTQTALEVLFLRITRIQAIGWRYVSVDTVE